MIFYVIKYYWRAVVRCLSRELDVADSEPINMSCKESVSRCFSCPSRLWVVGTLLTILFVFELCLSTSPILYSDIAQGYILQRGVFHSRDDYASQRIYIVGNDIGNADVPAS